MANLSNPRSFLLPPALLVCILSFLAACLHLSAEEQALFGGSPPGRQISLFMIIAVTITSTSASTFDSYSYYYYLAPDPLLYKRALTTQRTSLLHKGIACLYEIKA